MPALVQVESSSGQVLFEGDASELLLQETAMKLLELGRLSSGAAARLAGLSVPVFLARLADYGVAAFRMTEAQVYKMRANLRLFGEVAPDPAQFQVQGRPRL